MSQCGGALFSPTRRDSMGDPQKRNPLGYINQAICSAKYRGEITAAGKYPPCHTMARRAQFIFFGRRCGRLRPWCPSFSGATDLGVSESRGPHEIYHGLSELSILVYFMNRNQSITNIIDLI